MINIHIYMYNLYRYVCLSTYIHISYIMPCNLLFATDGSLQRTGISKTVKIGTMSHTIIKE